MRLPEVKGETNFYIQHLIKSSHNCFQPGCKTELFDLNIIFLIVIISFSVLVISAPLSPVCLSASLPLFSMQNPSLLCSELLHVVADQLPSLKVGGKGCIQWYQSFTSVSKCLRIHQSRWSCRSTSYPFSSVSVLDGAECTVHSYHSVVRAWALRAKQSSSRAWRMILHSNLTVFLLLQTDFWVEGREWQVPQKHSLSHGFMLTFLLIMWRKLCLDLWNIQASPMGKCKGGVGVKCEEGGGWSCRFTDLLCIGCCRGLKWYYPI